MKKEILNKERSIKTKTHQQRGATKVHQNGITLIALIITIIIMLILAGVVTNLTIGENGLFNISKQAGEDYKIASIKEKVEQEILVLQAGKIEKNEKLTIEQALVGIKETGIFSEIDLAEEIGIADGYIIKLGYDFWDNVIIEGINKDREIRINTSTEPEGYTNGNVIIDISVKSKNVTVSNIEVPSEMIKKEDGTYEVTKNGTYIIKVTLDNGETLEKEIKISTIDKLPPKDFEITATSTRTGININGATKDQEETTENTSSGIDHYEYFVKKSTDKKYTKYETKTVEVEGGVTYNIYVISYDKAGNRTQSNTITLEKITPPASNYGQGEKVNYTANGISDWEIFYKNEETNEIFIIASDYLLNQKLPSETQMSKVGTYRAQWPKTEPSYIEITDQVKNKYMMNLNTSISNENVKCMSRLLDTSIWNDFVRNDLQEKGVTAIGGPTLEMWVASWNDWYPEDPLSCNTSNSYGYYLGIGTNSGTSTYISDTDMKKKEGYRNRMYYPYTGKTSDGCKGYWVVAPSAMYKYDLFGVECAGYIKPEEFYMEGLSIRPVICLTTNVDLTYNNVTGMWDIN